MSEPQQNKLNQSLSVTSQFDYVADFATIKNYSGSDNNYKSKGTGIDHDQTVADMRSITKLITDISKYTILISISFGLTFIFAVIMGVVAQTNVTKDVSTWTGALLVIDNFINVFCSTMQFEVNKKEYNYKQFCSQSHSKCEDRYTRRVNKSVDSKRDGNGGQVKLVRLETGEIGIELAKCTSVSVVSGDNSGGDSRMNSDVDPDDNESRPIGVNSTLLKQVHNCKWKSSNCNIGV